MHLPVYMDFAAGTPVHSEVLQAMMPYFSGYFGNPSSKYHAYGWMAEEAIDNASAGISQVFNCKKNEIIFTSGATESINMAISGVMDQDLDIQLVTFATEHKATLETAEYWRSKGRFVEVLHVDNHGQPDLDQLEEILQNKRSLVSALWVNNETGVVFPIQKLEQLKQRNDLILHVDATQAVGKLDINWSERNIDLLSFSAHKIYGPKGMGALLKKQELALTPRICGGGQQRNLRGGTLNVPGIVGLAKAVELAQKRRPDFEKNTQALTQELEKTLQAKYSFVKIVAERSARICNISNICFEGHDGEDLLMRLHQVAVSNGSACNSAHNKPSHVLKAMGMSDSQAYSSIRFSLGFESKKEDLEVLYQNLGEIFN